MNRWERFDEIEIMALEELDAVWKPGATGGRRLRSEGSADV